VFAVVTRPEQVTQHIADVRTARPHAGNHVDARFNSPCNRSAIAARHPIIAAATSSKPGSCEAAGAHTACRVRRKVADGQGGDQRLRKIGLDPAEPFVRTYLVDSGSGFCGLAGY
jgi:hypothetical protein